MTLDVVSTRNLVVEQLSSMGFEPRDSDGSDFGRPNTGVRFKVGTSRGEVAITVWRGSKQVDALRVISDSTLTEAIRYLHQVSR